MGKTVKNHSKDMYRNSCHYSTNKQTFIADILLLLPYILIFVYYTLYIVGRLLGYLL